MQQDETLVVAIASRKGGVGKTTIGTALLTEANRRGLAALLIDIDPQGSADDWFAVRVDQETCKVVLTHPKDVKKRIRASRASGAEVVFVDTPGIDAEGTTDAIADSDLVLVPTRCGAHDLRAILRTIQVVRREGKEPLVLLNSVDTRSDDPVGARQTLRSLHTVEDSVVGTRPVSVLRFYLRYLATFKHTAKNGMGPCEMDPRGDAAKETARLYSLIERVASRQRAAKIRARVPGMQAGEVAR